MFDLYDKNIAYSRPEAYYFWFYYFFVNFIWMVIPGCEYRAAHPLSSALTCVDLLYQSVAKTGDAFRALDKMSKSLAGNGAAKPSNGPNKKLQGSGSTKSPKKHA